MEDADPDTSDRAPRPGRPRRLLRGLTVNLLGPAPDPTGEERPEPEGERPPVRPLGLLIVGSLLGWIADNLVPELLGIVFEDELTDIGSAIRSILQWVGDVYLAFLCACAAGVGGVYAFRLLVRYFAGHDCYLAIRGWWDGWRVRKWLVRNLRVVAVISVVVALGLVAGHFALPFLQRSDCRPPAEIAIATTRDAVVRVEEATRAYTDELRRDAPDGCRQVHVTVFAVEQAEDVREAVAAGIEGWDPTWGPLPHVWLPDSSVDVELARRINPEARFEVVGSMWTSPLILAVPPEQAERLGAVPGQELADPLAALREVAPAEEVPVVRADPGSSTAALLHTAFLYRRNGAIGPDGTLRSEEAVHEAEASLGGALSSSAGGEVALLCQASGLGRDAAAALTTLDALQALRSAEQLPADCERRRGAVTDLVPLVLPDDLVLDHPFVRLDWGVDSGVAEQVTALGSHLTARRDGAVTDLAGHADRAGGALERYGVSLGEANILLAVDVSTSMAMPGEKFDAAIAEADALAATATANDRIGLWALPRTPDPADTDAQRLVDVAAGTGGRVRERLRELAPLRESTPLREVIAEAVTELAGTSARDGGPPMLVVLTDGVGRPRGGRMDAARLDEAMQGSEVRVRIVAVGGRDQWGDETPCEVDQIEELTRDDRIECVAVDPDDPGQAGRRLLAQARAGEAGGHGTT
ncbi:hypothetical protein ACQEU5_03440 [Marinactinospora thermotolerans]|uniref:hypothetical protein n=1 Tax=Marinactinospora thermotolerans TaxID=531310 RepID=UPI003D93485E